MLKTTVLIKEAQNGFSISINRQFIDPDEKENNYEEKEDFIANNPEEVSKIVTENWELETDQ